MDEYIQIHSVAPLISALALYSLAIVTFFSMKREMLWLVFAGFSLFLASASAVAFSMSFFGAGTAVIHYAQLAPSFGILALSFANYYAYLLTGSSSHARMFGKKAVSVRAFLCVVSVWVALLTLLVVTHQFIAEVEVHDNGRLHVHYGPFMYFAMAFIVLATARNTHLLAVAYRSSTSRVFREFVVLNIVAFLSIFLPAIALFFVGPLLGKLTQAYAFFTFPVAVTIFYIAIVRYQFAQNRELNLSLEEKVEERTAELRKAQSKLAQSEKMASMGQLVAGINESADLQMLGSPEMSLYTAALSDICSYLNLPLMGTAGASEAKTMDQGSRAFGRQFLQSRVGFKQLLSRFGSRNPAARTQHAGDQFPVGQPSGSESAQSPPSIPIPWFGRWRRRRAELDTILDYLIAFEHDFLT